MAGGQGGDLPRVFAEQTANLQYTSGTTGHPKGCVLSNFYWVRLARMIAAGPPDLGPDDVLLAAQPFYYMDPQWNLAIALLVGGELVVLDRFHPSTFWQDVRSHGVTFFYCLGMMPMALHNMPPERGRPGQSRPGDRVLGDPRAAARPAGGAVGSPVVRGVRHDRDRRRPPASPSARRTFSALRASAGHTRTARSASPTPTATRSRAAVSASCWSVVPA